MTYEKEIIIEKGKFKHKDLQIKGAMAKLYASSPYLSDDDKDKFIEKLFE